MANLNKELMLLVMQFLREEKYKDTVHKLEQESGIFFNMKYLEDKVHAGEWAELEKYISGFTKFDDNRYSMKIFFEIRKQKFLEALDRNERGKAVEILRKDLKIFATFNEELYKEFTQLLTLDNFRENEQLSKYGDTKSTRTMLLMELKRLVESNPLMREKLTLPFIKASRLQALINQSCTPQFKDSDASKRRELLEELDPRARHHLCRNPRPNPQMHSLFVDHTCSTSNGAPTSGPLTVSAGIGKSAATTFQHLGAHGSFQPTAAATNANAIASWMRNAAGPPPVPPMTIAGSSTSVQPNHGQNFSAVPVLKRSRTPPFAPGTDHEQSTKRARLFGQTVDEVSHQAPWSLDDLPRTVVFSSRQASSHVTSFDFHPSHQTLLLVGSGNAEITLWEIASRERLVSKPFKIWNMSSCSAPFQASIVKDSKVSINRVTWNPDGNFIGVAFTKHLIQLYTFRGRDLHEHIEIDAHVGSVNDLAFSYRKKQVCVISCGDDKLIKVWDLAGQKLFNFEGHEAPVYSICACYRDNIQFLLSTSTNGQIKAWLYDSVGSIVDYGAPGHGRSTMLYSGDGTRLFSCGTNKDGDFFLVEWNESEGSIKRTYTGFKKKSAGNVQFDTSKNRFLAVGEDHQIKFWDMDHINILSNTEADGGLAILPRLRFNKDGNLLAVTTTENGFKVLANTEALRSLRAKSRSNDVSRSLNEASAVKVSGSTSVVNTSQTITRVVHIDGSSPPSSAILNEDDPAIRSREIPRKSEPVRHKGDTGEVVEIIDPANCQVVDMPNSADSMSKVSQLLYTNTGGGILALGSNGIQKIWKWNRDEQNPSGKATAGAVPQHWQPTSGLLMINDVPEINLSQAETCIALSKNDSYVMSASGGKVSLFNMMTFKVLTKFLSPPPATTCLAFHPQDNNIIAAGADDGTVKIYNVRFDEVLTKWKSHQDCTTGLCFSTKLNILVTSGTDCMVCTWSTNTWLKRRSAELEMPVGKLHVGDTRVQFHSDQVLLLAFHETQLAIYDATDMQRIRRWVPQAQLSAPITYAAYSCNSELIYSAFTDGNIGIFDGESLALKCLIAPSAYMSQVASNRNQPVYPRVVAAHPLEPNQFAVGLTNGTVKVIEPLESEGKWGVVVVFVEDEAPNDNIEAPAAPETTPSQVSESALAPAPTATVEPTAAASTISNPSSEKLQK